jgi:hypothetical protein
MKARVSEINFIKISEDDLRQFKLYSKRRLKLCLLFGGILAPLSLILASELATKADVSFFVCTVVIEVLYVFLALAPWWIYYAGKPKGIRYGRISAKNPERAGQYSGYSYNIYFEDIHKSLVKVRVSEVVPGNQYKGLKIKDSIKVVKCWSGVIITMR